MPVQFKFRGELNFRTLLNVTTPCSRAGVKGAIFEQARISDTATDLALEDAETGRDLVEEVLHRPDALVQVIVRRTPLQSRGGAESSLALIQPSSSRTPGTRLEAERHEEDLAIDRMVEQQDAVSQGLSSQPVGSASLRYARSHRQALSNQQQLQGQGYDAWDSDEEERLANQKEPPPADYTCHRCGAIGSHWIFDCPTNDDPDHLKKVRTAKGVPRDFLRKVASVEEAQELSAGGVTFSVPGYSGHYIWAHEATEDDKKLRLGDTVKEKVTAAFSDGARKVEESLKCPLCNALFRQAILAPCCGATFCSDCIVDRLAHSSEENSRCPGCGGEVLAHQLVANEDIRKQVEQVSRATRANALASSQQALQDERPKAPEADALLKESAGRPRRGAAPDRAAAAGSAPLALTDAPAAPAPAATAPAPPPGPVWQPLGFGPMLLPAHFAAWQHAIRCGPPHSSAREQFEGWQRRTREVAPAPPSKEAFEEWQKALRGEKRAAEAAAAPELRVEVKRRKQDRQSKKERRAPEPEPAPPSPGAPAEPAPPSPGAASSVSSIPDGVDPNEYQ